MQIALQCLARVFFIRSTKHQPEYRFLKDVFNKRPVLPQNFSHNLLKESLNI